MRLENEKEIKFLQELTQKFEDILKTIGDLSQLPTSDKSSIVNAIRTLSIGTIPDPKIDPDVIIAKFQTKLNN
jgi:hypothetical protein